MSPMMRISEFARRVALLFRGEKFDREMDEEIRAHIEQREKELRENGREGAPLSAAEAHTEARKQFGNALALREASREAWGWAWLEHLAQDLKFALRMFRKNPGFTAIAILTLALGIGANTAIFSVVNAVVLRPLPFLQPKQLLFIRERMATGGDMSLSMPDFKDLRSQNHVFTDMACGLAEDLVYAAGDKPRLILAGVFTASVFPVLGAKMALGRPFSEQDDQPSASPTAVLAYDFWQNQFHGNPAVLGRALELSGKTYTIIGVLSRGFRDFRDVGSSREADVYLPLGLWGATPGLTQRVSYDSLSAVGRLRPGVTLAAARADLDGIMRRLDEAYPATNRNHLASVEPLSETVFGNVSSVLWLLLGAVGFVLLIACANIVNLQLARGAARPREFAVRAALGAGRGRVFRQLLTESVSLALLGGAAGLFVAWSAAKLFLRAIPAAQGGGLMGMDIPRLGQTTVDVWVFLFTLGVALAAGILFGLAPALHASKTNLNEALKEGGAAGNPRGRLRSALLVAEVALAVVLLISAGLMLRSLVAVQSVDLGFQPKNLLALDIVLARPAYKIPANSLQFTRQAVEAMRILPGVTDAGATLCPPLVGDCWDWWYSLPGKQAPSGEDSYTELNLADPSYFKTLEAPLLTGREFTTADTAQSERVAIVNEAFEKEWWPRGDAIGKAIHIGHSGDSGPTLRIVGVVANIRQDGMDVPQVREVFLPFAQHPEGAVVLVLRTRSDPMALTGAAEKQIHRIDPGLVVRTHPMTTYVANSLARRKFSSALFGLFGLLAIVLAGVGVYGVISYSVAQRTHEIGIRMALGAERRDVWRMILGQGGKIALVGIAIGIVAAFALTRLMASLLYGVSATDPLTFAGVSALLLGVALVACYVPARRAMRVDPMVALRYE